MQPNQAPPPVPLPKNSVSGDKYDFIMNAGSGPKKGFGQKLASGSKTVKIVIFGTGLVVLLILVVMFFSILGSSGKSQTESLISLAQTQAEIVRVSTLGALKASSSDAKDFALTAQFSMQTSQNNTIALLSKSGHKLDAKNLILGKNPRTDALLDEAANNNSFDETFTKIIKGELLTYQKKLQGIYSQSKSASEKQILSDSFNSVSLLLGNQDKK